MTKGEFMDRKSYPNQDGTDLELITKLLKDEFHRDGYGHVINKADPLIYLPRDGGFNHVVLQFCGWCIHIHGDGTWTWEDTTGG